MTNETVTACYKDSNTWSVTARHEQSAIGDDMCVQVCMHVHVPMSGLPQLIGTKSKWHEANVSMADDATSLARCNDCTIATTSLQSVDGHLAIWRRRVANCLG